MHHGHHHLHPNHHLGDEARRSCDVPKVAHQGQASLEPRCVSGASAQPSSLREPPPPGRGSLTTGVSGGQSGEDREERRVSGSLHGPN